MTRTSNPGNRTVRRIVRIVRSVRPWSGRGGGGLASPGDQPQAAGLHIHDTWDWCVRHPVVRLDFAGGSFKEPANLHEDVMLQLESIEDEMGIPARRVSAPGRLRCTGSAIPTAKCARA